MFTNHLFYYDNKNGSYQRGITYVTHAHINHETLIKSFNEKCKIKSHQANHRHLKVQIFVAYLNKRELLNEGWLFHQVIYRISEMNGMKNKRQGTKSSSTTEWG